MSEGPGIAKSRPSPRFLVSACPNKSVDARPVAILRFGASCLTILGDSPKRGHPMKIAKAVITAAGKNQRIAAVADAG